MSAPFQKMLCQIIKKQVLKNQCSVNKSCQRQLSFASFSFNTGSFNYMKTRYVKVVASIIGVSSVFVTKALWNSTAAKTSAPNQATSQNAQRKLTLYQFQSCPFCCKVRAALDYYGFSYDVVEVNSVTKAQLKFSSYKKVPVLVSEGENGEDFVSLNDSSVIVSILVSHLWDPSVSLATLKTYYPVLEEKIKKKTVLEFPNRYFIMYGDSISDSRTEKQRKEERKWRAWVDDVLVHMISPNVYRTPSESLEAFYHFSDWGKWDKNFSTLQRLLVIYVGAPVMYVIGKFIKRKYNLHDDVRLSLYQTCDEWMKAVGKRNYLGGDEPCVADLSVYGVLSSFEGCQAFTDLMANSKIKVWYYRIKEDIEAHKGARFTSATVK